MRSDIVPGGTFPDYALPDHTGTARTLSEIQGRDPLILTLARGNYCTLISNIPHLRRLVREYESFYDAHRPHRTLGQAAPLRPLPDNVIDLETLRVRRRDRARGLLHEYQ